MPLNDLISRARNGESSALGELLEQHRDQLRVIADRDLSQQLQKRVDASDIVQQTFLIAHQAFDQFRGEYDSELIAWLRTILDQNVHEAVRRHVIAQQRSVNQEVSLDSAGSSSQPFDPAATDSTPSHRVTREETNSELLAALESLPFDQSVAVRLKHIEGYSLAEVVSVLGKTEAAVAGLLRRGIAALKQKLQGE